MNVVAYLRLGVRAFRRNTAAIVLSTVAPLGIFLSFGAFAVSFQPDPSTVAVAGATAGVADEAVNELAALIPTEHFTIVSADDDPDIAIFIDTNRGIVLAADNDVTSFTTGAIEEALQPEGYLLLSTTTPGVPQVDYWARGMVALILTLALTSATTVATDTAEMRHAGALEQLVTLPVRPLSFFGYMFAGPLLLAITLASITLVVGLAVGILNWTGLAAVIAPLPLIVFFGLLGFVVALRIRSTEATLGIMLGILMLTMVLTSAFLPVGLLGVVDDLKSFFPPAYMVDLVRHSWTPEQADFGFGLALAVSLISLAIMGFIIHRSFVGLIGRFHERH
jgi:ABC-type multidrug transport system permease subunit